MPKVQFTGRDNSEGETEAHKSWDRGQQYQKGTMGMRRDMGVGVIRVNRDKAHIKGDGGGTPLREDSTKEDLCITEGGRRLVGSYLQGGTCPETGEQGGKTKDTQR